MYFLVNQTNSEIACYIIASRKDEKWLCNCISRES